jgi:hypothetical protein
MPLCGQEIPRHFFIEAQTAVEETGTIPSSYSIIRLPYKEIFFCQNGGRDRNRIPPQALVLSRNLVVAGIHVPEYGTETKPDNKYRC